MSLKDTLARVQEEQKAWVKHNFGDRLAWMPLMGAIEELGELAHAHLKEAQGIRNHENHTEKAKDAVADTVIYLSDYCSAMDINLLEIIPNESYSDSEDGACSHRWIFSAIAHLWHIAHDHHYTDKPIFLDSDVLKIGQAISCLGGYCFSRGWDFEAIISETWDKVKQRDWKKNPDTAHLEAQ